MISIIIPVYNAELDLERCLQSVLNQTYTDWECILVDDGSTDSSGTICDSYAKKDSRFRVIHQQNGGVSAARNTGLDAVKGEWITFSDSDDELTPNALADFIEAINRFPDVDVLRGGHTTITTSGKRGEHAVADWIETKNHAQALQIAEENFYSGFMWSSCFKKDILVGERFPNDITWCEDHIFTYRCMLKARSIVFVPSVVYLYYLDDRYPIGFGKGLSYKLISYEMAIKSAEEQRKVKMLLAGNDKEMQNRVQTQYEETIRLAHYYSCFSLNPLVILKHSKAYPFISSLDIIRMWLGYHKTRLTHIIKSVLNIY